MASCGKPLITCPQAVASYCVHILIASCLESVATNLLQALYSSHCMSQVVNKLQQACDQHHCCNLVLATRGRCNRDTTLLQPCVVNIVTILLYHGCFFQVVPNLLELPCYKANTTKLVSTTGNKQCEDNSSRYHASRYHASRYQHSTRR